jgi:hypothetical protein
MAAVDMLLPHQVTLHRELASELDAIDIWVRQQWPYTYGATVYRGWVEHAITFYTGLGARRGYNCSWNFQFESDAVFFRLTWG